MQSWRRILLLGPWMHEKCHGTPWQAKVAPPLW